MNRKPLRLWGLATLALFVSSLALADENTIHLKSRSIQPKADLANDPLGGLKKPPPDAPNAKSKHAIVQFGRPLQPEDLKALEASGVTPIEFVGANAYLAKIEFAKVDDAVAKLPFQALVDFEPGDKLPEAIKKNSPSPLFHNDRSGETRLLVVFHQGVTREAASATLKRFDLEGAYYGADNSWSVEMPLKNAGELAKLDQVKWIEEGPLPFLELNEHARRAANTDASQLVDFSNPAPQFFGPSGVDVRIGICEGGGFDESHDDFKAVATDGSAGSTRVYRTIASDGSHGTHVASIAGGSGFNSAANGFPAFSLRGHAPQAALGDYPSFGGSADSFHEAIVDEETDVTNHSYVQTRDGAYDSVAASLDKIVRGTARNSDEELIPARPQVWAAGNNGTGRQYGNMVGFYSVFTSAKNTISVGAVDSDGLRISDFSSLGPTYDGRIKPDIVAPGCYDSVTAGGKKIIAARNGTQAYTEKCGTSMAAPVVTGVVGLMRSERIRQGGTYRMYPSTYKAMLIHSATDMSKLNDFPDREFNNPDTGARLRYHAGPDYVNGYGLVNADGACELVRASNQWRQSSLGRVGAQREYCIYVPDGTPELKAVLAWDDLAGSTITAETASKLVNDLDLVLVDPAGQEHKPWVLDPLPVETTPGNTGNDPILRSDVKPAYRAEDHKNNVEMVSLCDPDPGYWRIRVRAHSLPHGLPQRFSLVSSRPFGICLSQICDIIPWICNPGDGPFFTRIDDEFEIPPQTRVPVDDICRYVLNCPGCEQALCPGWEMIISGVPVESTVHVVSQDEIQGSFNPSPDGVVKVLLKESKVDDQLMLVFSKRDEIKSPLERPFRCRIKAAGPLPFDPQTIFVEGVGGIPRIGPNNMKKEIENRLRGRESVSGYVVLANRPAPADRTKLKESGVILGGFLGDNKYEATFTRSFLVGPPMGILTKAGTFSAEEKVARRLWKGEVPKWAKTEAGKINVSLFLDEKSGDERIKKLQSDFPGPFKKSPLDGRWDAELSLKDIRKIAEDDDILRIELGPDPSLPLREMEP